MFSKVDIKLNNIIGSFVGIFIIIVLLGKTNSQKESSSHEIINKYKSIIPAPIYGSKYPEIIDFLHSVREFYFYNKRAFTHVVENLDLLLKILEDVQTGVRYCKYHYDIASEKRKNALNHLHSIIYSLEDNKQLKNKLIGSMKYLQVLTGKYLLKIENICNNDIKKNGYNIEKTSINSDQPRPYNIDQTNNNEIDNVFNLF